MRRTGRESLEEIICFYKKEDFIASEMLFPVEIMSELNCVEFERKKLFLLHLTYSANT